jgi:glycogen synthase
MEDSRATTSKRILMSADTVGGVWSYALELSRALAPEGIEVVLAAMGARLNKGQIREVNSIPNLEIFESGFKLEWMQDPWRDVSKAGEWLLEIEAKRNPDLIHLNGYSHGALPWHVPVMIVGHSCVLSWWKAVKGEHASDDWNRYRKEVTRGIEAVDLVVAPSRSMLNSLQEHYGPLPDSTVIYNGRETAMFTPAAKESFILSAGRLWDEAKNVQLLAKVAAELDWPVYLAGEQRNPNGTSFTHENVHLLGRLATDELLPWFSRASLYVLPARYEPFGLSVLEAALSGCALVLGDIPSLREIWEDAAVYVSCDDEAELKETLNQLIADRARLEELAAKAHARAQKFNPRNMAEHYLRAYSGLIGNQQLKTKELLTCAS